MAIYRGPGGSGDATTDANNEASVAANAAQEAEQSASQALGYAQAAATSATNAANSATAAASSASSASSSATTASNQAATASTAASNASTSASNAATSAGQASNSATQSANSASASNAYAVASSDSATQSASSAASSSASAVLAQNWAIKTDGPVAGGEYSSKYWATSENVVVVRDNIDDINDVADNIGIIQTVGSDLAGSGFNYDLGSITDPTTGTGTPPGNIEVVADNITNINTVATNIADIDTVVANLVDIQNAEENADAAAASASLANDWATKTSGPVAGGEYSAKYNAQQAASSASSASSSASSAASAQIAAESARDQTLAAYDNFDDRYLGTKSSDPTLDNDGNALIAGALYFNSVDGVMKVYTGTVWVAAYASLSGALLVANNLSDLSNTSTARSNLGVAIGTNVQAWDTDLDWVAANLTTAGKALLDDVDAAAQRTTLGLGTAATTNSTDYATAAQGTKADTAYGWGNHAVAGYAIDSTVVHLAGTETITGAKTFSSTITGSITGNAGTVTNGVYTSGSYADPSWITSLAETKVLPSQTGNVNKVLITNGTSTSFSLIDEDNLAALIDLGSI